MVTAIVFVTVCAAGAAEPDITGKYNCEGTNPVGQTYRGTVEITKKGDIYYLKWALNTGDTEKGVGLLEGNVLAVSYYGGTTSGVVVYRVEKDGKLVGRWTIADGNGKVYTETLRLIGATAQEKVTVGDVVWAEWKPNAWYHGKIVKADGKDFHIAFDDGGKTVVDSSKIAPDRVPEKDMLKVETRVLAKFKQARFYPGKIARIDGDRYDIKFEDGDVDTVALDDLRRIGQ
jgi:hypothetical protein